MCKPGFASVFSVIKGNPGIAVSRWHVTLGISKIGIFKIRLNHKGHEGDSSDWTELPLWSLGVPGGSIFMLGYERSRVMPNSVSSVLFLCDLGG